MATETLLPDAVKASSNVSNATTAAIAAEDGNYVTTVSGTVNTVFRVSFADPSAALSGTQTFTAKVRKNAGLGTNPTARIELYEVGGSAALVQTANTSVPSEVTNTTITLDWDPALLVDPSGAGVEARLVGVRSTTNATTGRSVDFDSLIWTASTVGAVAVSITPANATHAHSGTSPAITAAATASVSPDASTHSHAATSPNIAAKASVSPASALHDHSASLPAIAAKASVTAQNTAHSHTAGSPAVTAVSLTVQTLLVDTVISSTNLTNDTVPYLRSDDGAYAKVFNELGDTKVRVGFANPPGNISGPQTFTAKVCKSNSTGLTPRARLEIMEEGSAATLATTADLSVSSSTSDTTLTITVDASIFSDPTGAGVNARVTGLHSSDSDSFKASVNIDSIIWTASIAATGPAMVFVDDGLHVHTSSSPSIAAKSVVSVGNAIHGHTAGSPSIGVAGTISPSSAVHGHVATSPIIVIPALQGGRIGVWTGAEWAKKPVKVWNGTAWIEKPLRRWDGAGWL